MTQFDREEHADMLEAEWHNDHGPVTCTVCGTQLLQSEADNGSQCVFCADPAPKPEAYSNRRINRPDWPPVLICPDCLTPSKYYANEPVPVAPEDSKCYLCDARLHGVDR